MGRIATVPNGNGFGFIAIASVTKTNGERHDLPTTTDIFIHQDDSRVKLKVGTDVEFDVQLDNNRGPGHFRAVAATNGFALVTPGTFPAFTLVVPPVRSREEITLSRRLPIHSAMKEVPEAVVAKVIENAPLARIPRPQTSDGRAPESENKDEQLQRLLGYLFPAMSQFGADYRVINQSDSELDVQVTETIETYKTLGMNEQIGELQSEVQRFKSFRKALELLYTDGLARSDAIIPMPYLVDLFMAVPVWYFVTKDRNTPPDNWSNRDPLPDETVKHFCRLFPNERWMNTYQMFNRRTRHISRYKGENIPPVIAKRMCKAAEVFDYVVVATPYHDVAGLEWKDPQWQRAIDPYVLGFKKGIPFFFVIGRYSGTGTFPLFNELVADTTEFLRTNIGALIGFGKNPFWFRVGSDNVLNNAGNVLQDHTVDLLKAFEAGNLFDWLRGDGIVETR